MKKTRMMEKIARRAQNLTKNSIMTRQPKRLSKPLCCDIFVFCIYFQIKANCVQLKRWEKTDKESCRIRNWEWKTNVVVKREGNSTPSGLDMLDETEIFRGDENSLLM